MRTCDGAALPAETFANHSVPHDRSGIPPWATVLSHIVFAAACFLYGLSAIDAVRLPTDAFYAHCTCDDALYYLVPAQRLLAGQGYSFDGEHRTNGVQPLWAVVAIIVCAIAPDATIAARLLVLAGEICWGLMAVALYRALNRTLPLAGLVTGVGCLTLGFWKGLALNGMEAGLSGLTLAGIFAFSVNHFVATNSEANGASRAAHTREYLGLGLLLAFATLARVDYALLAITYGLLIWLSLISPSAVPRLRPNWRGALLVALPGAVLVGSFCLGSQLYFGTYLPVSGAVKLFYENKWPGPDALTALERHKTLILESALWPLGETWLRAAVGVLVGLGAIAGVILTLQARRTGRLHLTGRQVALGGLGLFTLAHGLMIALTLPSFTHYCVWYLVPQLLALWIGLGGLASLGARLIARPDRFLTGRGTRILSPLAVLLLVAMAIALVQFAARPMRDVRKAHIRQDMFTRAGGWFNKEVSPGQRIGANSAGRLAQAASRHQVFNLDGLMNDVQYFRKYLLGGGGTRAYMRDMRLDWFADYSTNAAWRKGWPRDTLELVRWFPAGDFGEPSDNSASYGIWRKASGESPAGPLSRIALPCRADERLQFAAEVLRLYPVVAEDGAGGALAAARERGERVVTSIIAPDSGRLHHVLMPVGDARKLGWAPSEVGLTIPLGVVFEGGIELVGADLLQSEYRAGQTCVWTLFWRKLPGEEGLPGLRFESGLTDANGVVSQRYSSTGCHDTYPATEWEPGELILETTSMPIPQTLLGRSVALQVGVQAADGRRIPIRGATTPAEGIHAATLDIR